MEILQWCGPEIFKDMEICKKKKNKKNIWMISFLFL